MLKVTAALLILGSFACYLLWGNEEKAETKSSHMLKEAEQSIKNAELSIQKAKQISLLHRINNLGIQDYCLLNNLLTEIL